MNDNTNTDNDSQQDNQDMITIDQLRSIGIDLPDEQMQALVEHAENTVSEQIGEEVVDSLDDDQLAEFVALQEADAPAEQVEEWIMKHVEDYEDIIEDNVAIVLGDLAESVESINSAK